MSTDWRKPTDNICPVLDAIIEYIPEPAVHEGDAQMLITSLDFSNYVGRIAIGRVAPWYTSRRYGYCFM